MVYFIVLTFNSRFILLFYAHFHPRVDVPCQAIDVWMGACTAFIFAALLEFTLVNYCYRKDLRKMHKDFGGQDEATGGARMKSTKGPTSESREPLEMTAMVSSSVDDKS
jgi:hypothetical protein